MKNKEGYFFLTELFISLCLEIYVREKKLKLEELTSKSQRAETSPSLRFFMPYPLSPSPKRRGTEDEAHTRYTKVQHLHYLCRLNSNPLSEITKNSRSTTIGFAILILLSITWGASFILIKKGLLAFSPMQVASLRIGIAGVAFLPFFIFNFKKEAYGLRSYRI